MLELIEVFPERVVNPPRYEEEDQRHRMEKLM
jgi:hypothetical protein